MVMTKEAKKLYDKEYRLRNLEKIKLRQKEHNKNPKRKMDVKINFWKFSGLICENKDEYEYIYDRWLYSEKCEEPKCNKEYTENNFKCMDHCHLTGLFRNILCNSCNIRLRTNDNSSGIPNIYKDKKGWLYRIAIKCKTHTKYSKDLEWLKNYKKEYENKYLYNI